MGALSDLAFLNIKQKLLNLTNKKGAKLGFDLGFTPRLYRQLETEGPPLADKKTKYLYIRWDRDSLSRSWRRVCLILSGPVEGRGP